MAKIGNYLLPPALNEQLVRELEKISDALLVDWGRSFLPGGFTRPRPIRDRLASMIRSNSLLDPFIQNLVSAELPLSELTSALSWEGIDELFDCLVALCGREAVLLTLVLDDREEVRGFAQEQLEKDASGPSRMDPETAKNLIRFFIEKRFLNSLQLDASCIQPGAAASEAAGLAAAVPPVQPESSLADLEQAITQQQAEIDRLQGYLKDEKRRAKDKLKEVTDQAATERDLLRAELTELQAKLQAAADDKLRLESRLQQLTADRDNAIEKAVSSQTSHIVRKWLAEPLQTEKFLQEEKKHAEDLLERVDKILLEQARHDRHTGNRLELAKKLENLLQARERLARTAQTALSPIPELRSVLTDVEAEIDRIKSRLDQAGPRHPLAGELLTKINCATGSEVLEDISRMLELLSENDLLAPEDRRKLYDALQRKLSFMEESGASKLPERDAGWSLRRLITEKRPGLLILDGHNILFRLGDLLSADYEDGHPGRKARERLVDWIKKLAAASTSLQVKVFFDGPAEELKTVAPNIQVEFSGGGHDPHRADHAILDYLKFLARHPAEVRAFVITDDRLLRQLALQQRAKYLPVDAFAVLLSDLRCL